MVDEARDESMKEQIILVFRYVDAEGFVKERFFGLIHVINAFDSKEGDIFFFISTLLRYTKYSRARI